MVILPSDLNFLVHDRDSDYDDDVIAQYFSLSGNGGAVLSGCKYLCWYSLLGAWVVGEKQRIGGIYLREKDFGGIMNIIWNNLTLFPGKNTIIG